MRRRAGGPGLILLSFERGYYVRVWTFFGDRERSTRWLAREPIVKASNMIARDEVPVPGEMRAWREKFGFDFGKFDYVRHENRWVLLDANRTPSAPTDRGEPIAAAIRELGDSIERYLS